MSRVTPDLLAECIAAVKSGRLTVDQCVESHPVEAEELRRLLELSSAILPPPPVQMDPVFRVRARVALVEAISAEKVSVTNSLVRRFWLLIAGRRDPARLTARRVSMSALIVALILMLTTAVGGGATYASQSTIPGDALYPVKTAVEELQIRLAGGDDGKAEANLDYAGARLDEAAKAIDAGRTDSAAAAIEGYASRVSQAEQHLAKAAASGADVIELATRLTENLARQQAKLDEVASRVPEQAKAALARAVGDAVKGLDTAIALADTRTRNDGRTDVSSARTITGTVTPGPTETPGPGDRGSRPLLTAPISSTVAVTLTQTISDVENLKLDPAIPGNSYQGLLAKLQALREALVRGRGNAALNQLNAFLNELNAMQRSGHISQSDYDALYADYTSLTSELGGTPGSHVAPNKSTPEATPQVGKPNSLPDDVGNHSVITSTVTPELIGPRGRPAGRDGEPEDSKPVTSPTPMEIPTPALSNGGESSGRPEATPVADPTQAPPATTPGANTEQHGGQSGRSDSALGRDAPAAGSMQPPASTSPAPAPSSPKPSSPHTGSGIP
ncbi:MAG: DUF5667 domain-containing protein [Dehalococcoidia bacterium]|nr:DUF5667 domain-containing protein [Dehalococcoidia bacterium]